MRSKAAGAETGSDGSQAKRLLDERAGEALGGQRRIHRSSSFGHRHIRPRIRNPGNRSGLPVQRAAIIFRMIISGGRKWMVAR
jgi:hypothetical protein